MMRSNCHIMPILMTSNHTACMNQVSNAIFSIESEHRVEQKTSTCDMHTPHTTGGLFDRSMIGVGDRRQLFLSTLALQASRNFGGRGSEVLELKYRCTKGAAHTHGRLSSISQQETHVLSETKVMSRRGRFSHVILAVTTAFPMSAEAQLQRRSESASEERQRALAASCE